MWRKGRDDRWVAQAEAPYAGAPPIVANALEKGDSPVGRRVRGDGVPGERRRGVLRDAERGRRRWRVVGVEENRRRRRDDDDDGDGAVRGRERVGGRRPAKIFG